MDRITIIGMGPVGASIGLALKRANLRDTEVVGSSGDRNTLSTLSKMEAMDSTTGNLRAAVNGAQLVILDVPISELKDLLEHVGPILEDGCVVTDTGTAKLRVLEWMEEYLPSGVNYVGGHPLPREVPREMSDASPSIFEDAHYCVIPSKSANQESVKTIVGLAETLGAKPIFLDPHEHDSYAAAMMNLPTIISAAFVNATAGSAGWREMHRLAASDFNEFSRLAANDPLDSEIASLASADALVHWIDQMITSLYSFRNQINDESDELINSFVKSWEARARWEVNAVVEDSGSDLPKASDTMAAAFLGDRLARRLRRSENDDKSKSWKYKKN